MRIFHYTTHFPVTVTWDTSVWSIHDTECYLDGSFFHHSNEIFEPGWWTSFDWHYECLGYLTSYQFDTTDNDAYVGFMDSVQDVGERFIYGIQLATNELENPISPCQYVMGIDDPVSKPDCTFKIYPNPANDFISIQMQTAMNQFVFGSIFNCQGVEVQKFHMNDNLPIRLKDLSDGVYFIILQDKKFRVIDTQSFVVARNH